MKGKCFFEQTLEADDDVPFPRTLRRICVPVPEGAVDIETLEVTGFDHPCCDCISVVWCSGDECQASKDATEVEIPIEAVRMIGMFRGRERAGANRVAEAQILDTNPRA